MISAALLFIPGAMALTNRLWRGEAEIPRAAWYAWMMAISIGTFLIMHPATAEGAATRLALSWLIFYLGYALLPWQAMFSAINGKAPSRQDDRYVNWLQNLSFWIDESPKPSSQAALTYDYRQFGVIYGTLRAAFMIPGIIMLCHYTGSAVPIAGVFGILMGWVYLAAGKLALHFNSPAMGVPLAEMTMGWWMGTYILIVASV